MRLAAEKQKAEMRLAAEKQKAIRAAEAKARIEAARKEKYERKLILLLFYLWKFIQKVTVYLSWMVWDG